MPVVSAAAAAGTAAAGNPKKRDVTRAENAEDPSRTADGRAEGRDSAPRTLPPLEQRVLTNNLDRKFVSSKGGNSSLTWLGCGGVVCQMRVGMLARRAIILLSCDTTPIRPGNLEKALYCVLWSANES